MNNVTKLAFGAALLMAGGAASASTVNMATFDLVGYAGHSDSLSFSEGDLSLDITAYEHDNGVLGDAATVGQWSTGVGVYTEGYDTALLDGRVSSEIVVLSFSQDVQLESIVVSHYDIDDTLTLATYELIDGTLTLDTYASDVGLESYFCVDGCDGMLSDSGVTSSALLGGTSALTFGVGTEGDYAEFKISSITVSYDPAVVPLPASGLFLIAALGGMAAVRRRQKA